MGGAWSESGGVCAVSGGGASVVSGGGSCSCAPQGRTTNRKSSPTTPSQTPGRCENMNRNRATMQRWKRHLQSDVPRGQAESVLCREEGALPRRFTSRPLEIVLRRRRGERHQARRPHCRVFRGASGGGREDRERRNGEEHLAPDPGVSRQHQKRRLLR